MALPVPALPDNRFINFYSVFRLFVILVCFWTFTGNRAYGGSGPETTLIVVNGDSPVSLAVANEYVKLRHIPQSHIVWLHGIPSLTIVSVDTFRNRIWGPIHEFILDHDLEDEIDVIAYSADFPYAVDFKVDLKPHKIKLKPPFSRDASLTGFTFFAHRVESKNISYLSPTANRYFRYDRLRYGVPQDPLTDQEKQLFEQGSRALTEKDYSTAEKNFLEYVGKRPSHAAGWYKLAVVRAGQSQGDKAIEDLSKAVDRGYVHVLQIEREEVWNPYRKYPLFSALIKKMSEMDVGFLPPLGFKHQHHTWGDQFSWYPQAGSNYLDRYYLSTMLAYTGERGNSLSEVFAYLRSAASSDGTQPDGTVYLMNNTNVRSTTRQPLFPNTVSVLKRLQRKVEILSRGRDGQNGVIPVGKKDVIGIVAGTKSFDWSKANSGLLPGAIAESLTSYGAKFASRKQTKLTEFLRHGAAGSSGAVAEPFAVQEKFPVPYMHVYYAAGCSLAEAFYQSLAMPYQLLIVGDPLARPYAKFADIRFSATDIPTVQGLVKLLPEITPVDGHEINPLELWVDGQLVGKANVTEGLKWDTRAFADGYHQLRVIAEQADWVGTRSYAAMWKKVANTNHRLVVDRYDRQVSLDQTIVIHGLASGAHKIDIKQGERVLKTKLLRRPEWKAAISASRLGMGTVHLSIKASYPDGSSYISFPLEVEITLPQRLNKRSSFENGDNGILLTVTNARGERHQTVVHVKKGGIDIKKALDKGKIQGRFQKAQLEGSFYVGKSGFYQFVVKTDSEIAILVDDSELLPPTQPSAGSLLYVPMNLQDGWHDIAITWTGGKVPSLNILLSGTSVAQPLSDKILRHGPVTSLSAGSY